MNSLVYFLRIAFLVIAGFAFLWLVVLKVIGRLLSHFGISEPCPASVSWIVNNPIRERYTRHVLDHVGLLPGERVLELGPGPGLFTTKAARRIQPGGNLVVVDIQPEMIAKVEKKLLQAGVHNVETHVASAYELPVDTGSMDRAFLITVLQEIPKPDLALMELFRVLKPGGVLSISEEFLDPDYHFAFETIRQVEKAGFQLSQKQGNWWFYTVNFLRV